MKVWSNPHHGVSHLQGIPKTHQITMIARESFHEIILLSLKSETPFKAQKEFTGTKAECIYVAEQWSRNL